MSLLSIAIPLGALNFAEVPVPSVFPATPDPAIVVTFPAGVIFLMIWLPVSATYKLLLESIAIPVGLLNLAQVPKPSVFPVQLKQPANTETNPAGDICKMLDPEPLTTYKLLYVSIVIPFGPANSVEDENVVTVCAKATLFIKNVTAKSSIFYHFICFLI